MKDKQLMSGPRWKISLVAIDTLLTVLTFLIRFFFAVVLWERNLTHPYLIGAAIFVTQAYTMGASLFRLEIDRWCYQGGKLMGHLKYLFVIFLGIELHKIFIYFEVFSWTDFWKGQFKILISLLGLGVMRSLYNSLRIKLSFQYIISQQVSSILNFLFTQIILILNVFNIIEPEFSIWGVSGDILIILWFFSNMILLWLLRTETMRKGPMI